MPSGLEELNLLVSGAAVVTYAYIIFSSLQVRKALAVGPHRRQALGVGIVAGVLILDQLAFSFPQAASGPWAVANLAAFVVVSLGLLYWVDSSILAARRSDPLDRDTLHWGALRQVIWVVSVSSILGIVALSLVFPPSNAAKPPFLVGSLLSAFGLFPIYSAGLGAVVVMPIAARRCRDPVFRRHLVWFFVWFAIQFVVAGAVGQFFESNSRATAMSSVIDGIGLLLGFFPLYWSSRTLVPIYKFGADS